jgi:anaerobic selenocysteine-containing dehydrogenase
MPLRRTRPKRDRDPGWEPIGWDTALAETAAAMRRAAQRHGSEAVAFDPLIGSKAVDPVSGTAPHRSYLCEIRRAAPV